ncbi:STAS/SEC14 domain-containing protein [Iodobacter ciconiae]|uniref:STAS/SEC14 domain-containing protein n=1 Tax=Iodobacter ciconiae TaxID=2496266 RepID=A0A3S8ZSE9_9NEIS|nr:STAS/SEC14 domain-containing protein [Iodobacter ciconiae]AZN36412.1 STAS/SEC14 domain-containing protein [Iodobacter ciconiae]
MISISHENDYIQIMVFGAFTLQDYREFEQAVLYQSEFYGPVALLFDLHEMLSYTLDMAWEEIKFIREHGQKFQRVAVVSSDQWVTWSAWMSRLFTDAEIGLFTESDDARTWLMEESDPNGVTNA